MKRQQGFSTSSVGSEVVVQVTAVGWPKTPRPASRALVRTVVTVEP